MTAAAHQDHLEPLMVERYQPYRRPAVAGETPLSERLAGQAGQARLEAAAREAFPDLVTCRGCGDLREPDTICPRCQARRDAAARRRRLHRLESRTA